ncbi:MAG: hypothetical protein ACYDBH_00570 [Acidobacteriaceae bacterium]
MAKLTTKARKAIPTSEFAGPNRSYPIPDREHGANAKARAAEEVKKGNLTPSTARSIDAKVNRKFGFGAVKKPRK